MIRFFLRFFVLFALIVADLIPFGEISDQFLDGFCKGFLVVQLINQLFQRVRPARVHLIAPERGDAFGFSRKRTPRQALAQQKLDRRRERRFLAVFHAGIAGFLTARR